MKTKTKRSAPGSLRTIEGNKIVWGFLLENTLFTEFEKPNHVIIEAAFRQRKQKNTSSYVDVVDNNLPTPHKARVYFGVAQMHLRMPGTRYYVQRRTFSTTTALLSPGSVSSFSTFIPMTPSLMPSPISTASTRTTTTTATATSTSSSSDLLQPPPHLDPTLAALFSEEMLLPGSANSSTFAYNPGMCSQLFMPIENQNVNYGFTTTFGNNSAGDYKYNNDVRQECAVMRDFNNNMSFNQAAYFDLSLQYTNNNQFPQQQSSRVPMNSVFDYGLPGTTPTDSIDLLQDTNWLNDELLYSQLAPFSNNIPFQNLVSWPDVGPSLVPKFRGHNGNINMTNTQHDKYHFTCL